ncbi:MAG: hypothetical protein ACM3ZV_02585 [Bacillota bacterium]
MKIRALLSATALVGASFTSISTPAFATPTAQADAAAPDEQQICDDLYVNTQADPTVWRATVINDTAVATDPAPEQGTEENVNFRPDDSAGASFSYAGFTNTTNPLYRIGGSPNMWGQMVFNDKVWDNTLYDVQMQFNHTVTYNFTCHVEENVTTTTHVGGNPNPSPGHDPKENEGCAGDNGGSNNDPTAGNSDHVCGDGGHDVTTTTWTFRADYPQDPIVNTVEDGPDITQSGLQQAGHVEGVNYDNFGTYTPYGYILLSCISPNKKGASWTAKSYYTGGQCSTTTFNSATTILGHQFDSPPTNSVPGL